MLTLEFVYEDSRFNDITYQFLNPRPQTPPTAEPAVVEFLIEDAPEETPDLLVGGMPLTIATTANSFQFVQDDELEAELVQQEEEEQPADVEVTETITEVTVNGHTVVEDTVTVTTTTEVPILHPSQIKNNHYVSRRFPQRYQVAKPA